MPSTVLGLPVHPLVVHAVVILVPLAALLLLASALSPRLRRWARVLTPVTAVVALLFVPLATSSGENLEGSVAQSHLVEEHAELGDTLLPLMAVVAVLAIVLFLLERRAASGRSMPGKALVTAVLVLSRCGVAGHHRAGGAHRPQRGRGCLEGPGRRQRELGPGLWRQPLTLPPGAMLTP